ncbi:MAG TPA: chaperone modulator CbpM [Steroidobacteraceae bacterium]|nr:chaperone modulator CbpM [Steroidobacteraceae bacterium]
MPQREIQVLTGSIFEQESALSIEDLGRLCAADCALIVELVDEGILDGARGEAAEWRFSGAALRRARAALRLQRDLQINLAGVALALELMDEIHALRRRLRGLG